MLNQKTKDRYVDHGGINCPYCGSDDIEGQGWEWDGQYQNIECHKCHKCWRDCYSLVDIEEVEA